MMSRTRRDFPHIIVLLAALGGVSSATACAGAYRPNEWATIVDEEALVVWNPEKKLEHFVRRASFRTHSRDFGFLVPTPTQPTLGEVDDAIFARLVTAGRPEDVEEWSVSFTPLLLAPFLNTLGVATYPAPASGVRVLDAQQVAGYDAVILETDDAAALAKWLGDHGYETRPALAKWLERYVADHWKITAFKIAKPSGAPAEGDAPMAPKSVRLSFAAERLFFPYREPEDQREKPGFQRNFRLFVVAPQRMGGSIDAPGAPAWAGRTLFSDSVEKMDKVVVDSAIVADLPKGAWLTTFVEQTNPRPGVGELVLAPSADPAPVRPRPTVHRRYFPVPADVVLGLVFLVWFLSRRRSKK